MGCCHCVESWFMVNYYMDIFLDINLYFYFHDNWYTFRLDVKYF